MAAPSIYNTTIGEGSFADISAIGMPGRGMPGLSRDRLDYATTYGYNPSKLPYQDEVDLMNENVDRYQEANHWYSSMQKPNEDNLEVLKKLNHDRLENLSRTYKSKREELDDIAGRRVFNQDFIKSELI